MQVLAENRVTFDVLAGFVQASAPMTVAEARRLLSLRSNYALAKRLEVAESTISRWGRMVPDKWLPKIKTEAQKQRAA